MMIPDSLAAYPQFILYTVAPSATRPGKTDKFPVHPITGRKHNAHDPSIWLTAEAAQAAVVADPSMGIGFVFTRQDPFFFLDLDDALHSGRWADLAVQLCNYLAGCYVEVSVSGKGLHIIGAGVPAPHGCKMTTPSVSIDLYTEARFCALTGISAHGDPLQPAQGQLDWMIANYFPPSASQQASPAEWTSEPDPDYTGPADDEQLIAKMLASKSTTSAFSGKASVSDLWAANTDALAVAYPPEPLSQNPFDHSSADAALCQHLAFWTGKDCERMDRIFRQSALYREKWERTGYAQGTILKAVAQCRSVYTYSAALSPDVTPANCKGLRDGVQMLSVASQIDYFKGCVYVRSLHRVFVPDGELLKPDQFKATFGGYMFNLDLCNDKTTRNPWEALTENMGYSFPWAHDACFRPECEPGEVIREEDRLVVNTYVPVSTPRIQGDASPFTKHIAKMLPHPKDQAILLAYMAAVCQYPGKKFQWWPLIQGMEGNGKSLIIRALEFAVGKRYSHKPNAKDIDNKFNEWIRNKLFIGVEEIYTADRQDKIDALKPIITDDRIDIQGKGTNQVTGDNRANGVMNSNHKDAVRKTLGDRRYCVFYTAQQEHGDLEKAGMSGDYFPNLYDWLRKEGYAIVNDFLRSYQIPDHLNPATHCHRAPDTSSTAEAVKASLGSVEQNILEAIDEGRAGFANDWVSSAALEMLLAEHHLCGKIPPNKRRDILRSLGYDWHPTLSNGRTNNPIPDCGRIARVRLFVRMGSPAMALPTAAEVVKAYQDAQRS